MIGTIARSPMGRSLIEFADKNNLSDTWDDTRSAMIDAHVSGWKLDNQNAPRAVIAGEANDEMLVTLHSPEGECVVNLNDILALAAAYVRVSYARARSVMRVPVPSPSPAPGPVATLS